MCYSRNRTCYKCDKSGYFARDCAKGLRKVNKPRVLPFDISLITRSALNSLGQQSVDASESVVYKGFGHSLMFCTEVVAYLSISIGEFEAHNVPFQVMDEKQISHDVVIGVDFLYQYYLAPSPAHHKLIYASPGVSPIFIGSSVSFSAPLRLDNKVSVKPPAINYIKVERPELPFGEIVFKPNKELLESSLAFCRSIESMEAPNMILEVLCLSPGKISLPKGTIVGTVFGAEIANTKQINY